MSMYDNINQIPNLQALKANPVEVLRQRGLNIPSGMNDPQAIINHLLTSGQINNPRLMLAQQMAQKMGFR